MHFKAPDNSLHFIEPEFAHMLPAGYVPITDEEAEAIRIANAPVYVEPEPIDPVQKLKDFLAANPDVKALL